MTREHLLGKLGALLVRALAATWRLNLRGLTPSTVAAEPGGVIFCFWHNRILAISLAFLRRYPGGRKGVTVLTSASRDGEILSAVMAGLGMDSVRGSSSRRGSRAQREMARVLHAAGDAAITPDGPRGPCYALSPGVIQLAQLTGAPIYPVHATFSRAIRMNTWDGFMIPLPFSRITVVVDKPLRLPRELAADEFENTRLHLQTLLRNGAD
jgi:hypothetical protein